MLIGAGTIRNAFHQAILAPLWISSPLMNSSSDVTCPSIADCGPLSYTGAWISPFIMWRTAPGHCHPARG